MLVEFKIEVLIFSIKIRVSFLWSRIFKLFKIISPLYLKSILEIWTLEFKVDVIFDEILDNIFCSIFSLFIIKKTQNISSK